ncbi:Aspartate aminotransferase, cytoplasmic [Fusarium solani]|nr:Aspartate aminotransferase, cytoplasmic [Fusarium solani]
MTPSLSTPRQTHGGRSILSSTDKTAPTSSSSFSSSISRLNHIARHLSPIMASTTNFPADIVPQAPEDALFGLARAYKADESTSKVDLGIGAYRDENAKPWVLPVVKKADEILRNDPELNHEYAPIAGIASFTSKAAELIFGADSQALQEKRTVTLQTISGTGAVHLGALFLAKFYQGPRTIYVSNPTWANHHQIFKNVGLTVDTYPYFHKETKGLDFEGLKETLQSAAEGSVFVLHACAHNPTGVDPTQEQWTEIAAIMKEKKHFPFFDTAYQGFASGDLARDAWSIRYFTEQGFELVVAQSFAKNFGLYGERAGCFHAVTPSSDDASTTITRIGSQLAVLQRSEISNPPLYGARIVSTVLNDADLFAEWEENLRTMSGRIISMRDALRSKLEELETPGTWNHITDQIGMFSFTGLTESQVLKLREEFHIYMTKNGRISMAGLNENNVEYFAKAVDKVVRDDVEVAEE